MTEATERLYVFVARCAESIVTTLDNLPTHVMTTPHLTHAQRVEQWHRDINDLLSDCLSQINTFLTDMYGPEVQSEEQPSDNPQSANHQSEKSQSEGQEHTRERYVLRRSLIFRFISEINMWIRIRRVFFRTDDQIAMVVFTESRFLHFFDMDLKLLRITDPSIPPQPHPDHDPGAPWTPNGDHGGPRQGVRDFPQNDGGRKDLDDSPPHKRPRSSVDIQFITAILNNLHQRLTALELNRT
jgi:hypothetical protein